LTAPVRGLAVDAEMPLRGIGLDVHLAVEGGARLALVGPSGAGKTTVLRVIAGLASPARGRVSLGDVAWLDTQRGVDLPPERRRCGFVFQDYALFGRMPAWRNVAFGMRHVPRGVRRERAIAVLERFGVAALAGARPGTLSGGERQRVALARALASDPQVLLLDEPLSALDPATRSRSMRELDAMLAGLGIPVAIVSHSFEEAALLAQRVAVLDRGIVIQSGTVAEVSARPASAFVADFAGSSVIEGTASREPDGLTLVRLDGGGELRSTDPAVGRVAASVHPSEVAIEPAGTSPSDSALNHLPGEVTSLTPLGNRVRVGLAIPQPLAAEVTARSADALGLRPGVAVVAAWKATATRLVDLGERG
jgi:molybdate transport system ATP-binding protein